MNDTPIDQAKFDAVLRQMASMKPMTAKELSAKLRADKAAARSKFVRKKDK